MAICCYVTPPQFPTIYSVQMCSQIIRHIPDIPHFSDNVYVLLSTVEAGKGTYRVHLRHKVRCLL